MNNKAHLLCDASYDSSLNIGVAAYSLVAQGKTTRKTLRLSNVSTSQECELVAINEGLRALANAPLQSCSFISVINTNTRTC
ncbi:hypothetical protein AB6D11_18570 [Vibrio splendidus]